MGHERDVWAGHSGGDGEEGVGVMVEEMLSKGKERR